MFICNAFALLLLLVHFSFSLALHFAQPVCVLLVDLLLYFAILFFSFFFILHTAHTHMLTCTPVFPVHYVLCIFYSLFFSGQMESDRSNELRLPITWNFFSIDLNCAATFKSRRIFSINIISYFKDILVDWHNSNRRFQWKKLWKKIHEVRMWWDFDKLIASWRCAILPLLSGVSETTM